MRWSKPNHRHQKESLKIRKYRTSSSQHMAEGITYVYQRQTYYEQKIFLENSADICYMLLHAKRFSWRFLQTSATCNTQATKDFLEISADSPALLCCYYRRLTSLHSHRAQLCNIHAVPAGLLLATLKTPFWFIKCLGRKLAQPCQRHCLLTSKTPV